MKTIAILIPYFGKLPYNFELFLNCCRNNKTLDFMIFTDDIRKWGLPPNVRIYTMEFEEIQDKIKAMYDFEACISRPYKLCDYRPAYGELFRDYIKGYDFWGWSDMDLFYGDIRSFLTDDVLENNDRILTRGHLSLFKNNPSVNSYYRTLDNHACQNYRDVYQHEENFAFDEWSNHTGGGISQIFKENAIPMYDRMIFSDIQKDHYQLISTAHIAGKDGVKKAVFEYDNGKLYEWYLINNTLIREEKIYIHLAKRKLNCVESYKDHFLIIPPNEITMYEEINKRSFRRLTLKKKIWFGDKYRKIFLKLRNIWD